MKIATVQKYVNYAAPLCGLAGWDIMVSDELPSSVCEAETYITEGQHAEIRLAPAFAGHDPIYQRLIICHELCHCHCCGFTPAVEALKSDLAPSSFRIAESWFDSVEEHVVEVFARLLAPSLKLPRF